MGRSYTPKYVVKYVLFGNRGMTDAAWMVKQEGAPTEENLRRHVKMLEESTQPGGCNAHCGRMDVASARIVRQADGVTVAEYKGPMFLAVA